MRMFTAKRSSLPFSNLKDRRNQPMSKIPALFGSMVFSDAVMKERLPAETYRDMKDAIRENRSLDRSVADIVANAMKDWAVEKGATHYPVASAAIKCNFAALAYPSGAALDIPMERTVRLSSPSVREWDKR